MKLPGRSAASSTPLSERDRTLLLLRHEGVPYKTLAQVVGVRPPPLRRSWRARDGVS